MNQGGVQIGEPAPVNVGLVSLITGKATLGDEQKLRDQKNAAKDKENEDRLRAIQIAKEEEKLRSGDVTAPPIPAASDLPVATLVSGDGKDNTQASTGSNRPVSISLTSETKFRVVALYDHDADAEDELSFKVDDSIDVLDDTDEGWWYGRNCRTSKGGLFPANYTRKV